ncbi:tryptophan synthase beta subunit-like PLP-dependent enzyme, partial [Lophiotrema nucula]
IGSYIKRIMPHVKIIGVVTSGSNAMLQSLALGRRVRLSHVNKFADGVAVKVVGKETFRICREVVDQMIEVATEAKCEAIRDVYEETRVILEPAGALALAGLKVYARATSTDPGSTRALVAVASGANMDFDGLKYVAKHAAAHSGECP